SCPEPVAGRRGKGGGNAANHVLLNVHAAKRLIVSPRWMRHRRAVPGSVSLRACLRSPYGPRRELFARRPRKNEGVDVRPRLSDDAGMWANRPGPGIDGCRGCLAVAAMRQRAA